MARGSAPLIVALVSIIFLGVDYGLFQIAALALIITGLISQALIDYRAETGDGYTAAVLALAAGSFISATRSCRAFIIV